MTVETILTDLLQREGGWRDAKQRPDGTFNDDGIDLCLEPALAG